LLWWYEGTDGFKTGWTQEAKYCLASTVERNGLRLIAVVMGVPEVRGHFQESMKIYNYGFAKYTYKEFAPAGSKQGEIIVHKGTIPTVDLIAERAVGSSIEKGKEDSCRIETKLETSISAPVEKGQVLGEIIIYCDNEEMNRIKLIATETVKKANLWEMIKRTINESYKMAPSIFT